MENIQINIRINIWIIVWYYVFMCILMLEDHLNVTPSLDLDVQLVTQLMMMMEKNCPECII